MLVNVQESGGVFQFFGGRMTSRGQCPRGGGVCACECPRVGAFFKLMTSRGQCPRGCCECLHPAPPPFRKSCIRAWCSTHPSSDPPPPPGWLATGLMYDLFTENNTGLPPYIVIVKKQLHKFNVPLFLK